jgi:Domain of unknown function (DUF5060)/Secretion system C-terminal sorting domain/Putative collagen-binding domain of a collagenase
MKLKFIYLVGATLLTINPTFSNAKIDPTIFKSINNKKAVLFAPIITGELKKWHKVTIDFQGPATSETDAANPFMNYRLDVTFTNGTKTYVVPGYYAADGNAAQTSANSGNVWRVHFAPDATGTWTYKASFRTGANVAVADNALSGTATSFDGQTGTFAIANSDKTGRDLRGKGRLQYVGQHYLRFAETGDYFIKAGADAMENTLAYDDIDDTSNRKGLRKSWSLHQRDYDAADAAAYTWKNGKGSELLGSVKYLSDQGMNAFSFLTFNLGGDDENVFPQLLKISVAQYEALAAINNTQQNRVNNWNQAVHHDRFDVSKMAQWENIFEYADKKGMYLHFKTMETETDDLMDNATLGNERKIYYRELIARFGHHLALNWNICEEISLTVPVVKNVASYIKATDPYDHNIVLHTYPTANDYNNYYNALTGTNSELTGASMQIATLDAIHGTVKTWVANSATSGKKWVVANDEQGNPETGVALDAAYPANQLPAASTRPDNRDEVRNKVLWGTLLAGGDGVEYYYGYQTGCTDLNGQDHRTRETKWKDAKIALEFFNKYLQPHLTTMVNNDNLTSATNDYALTKPGSVYVSYLPTGGGTMINLAGVSGTFNIKWYDPRNGGALQNGNVTTVNGGGNVGTGNPPNSSGSDWVVLITSQSIVLANNEVGDYKNNSMIIYPNPVSDLLNIKGLNSNDGSLTVYDMTGKSILNNPIITDENKVLDFSKFATGIYIIKTDSGKVMRFVKQ